MTNEIQICFSKWCENDKRNSNPFFKVMRKPKTQFISVFQSYAKAKNEIRSSKPFFKVRRKRKAKFKSVYQCHAKTKNGYGTWIPFSHAIEKRLALRYTHSGAMQFKKFEFLFISPEDPFGKLLSKTVTIFKSSSEAPFLPKIEKFKIGLNLEIMQIRAFSKRSYEKTKGSLFFIFTRFDTHFSKLLSSYILSWFRIFSISYTRTKNVMFRHLLTP